MSENSFLKRRWKLIVNIVTVIALLLLAYAIRRQLLDTLAAIPHVRIWALLLLIPLEFVNYDAQARLYRSLFETVGNKLSYRFLFKLSLELNFVNHVFPSGGVTGISYFGMRMRATDITGGRATLIQLMKMVTVFLSFEVLLIFGLILLAAVGRVNDLTILVAGSLTTLMIVGTFVFTYIIGSEERIQALLLFFTRLANRLLHMVRPNHPETINIARARMTFEELHQNYLLFRRKIPELRRPFCYGLLANLSEVLAVYAVFVAFGHWVNLGAVILAYAVANFAGLVSVLPGGVGVYEALMTGVLVVAGVPAAVSIPVIIMYRVVNTIIQVPPGYFIYQRALS